MLEHCVDEPVGPAFINCEEGSAQGFVADAVAEPLIGEDRPPSAGGGEPSILCAACHVGAGACEYKNACTSVDCVERNLHIAYEGQLAGASRLPGARIFRRCRCRCL